MKTIISIRIIFVINVIACMISCNPAEVNDRLVPKEASCLKFNELSKTWDEGIPLGNGMLGVLIWEREGKLRFSLDRADLWDLRPMENLDKSEWRFSWVRQQWEKNTYEKVQQMFDAPYDRNPAPSKIPGAALEFNISKFGKVKSFILDISTATCRIEWESGVRMEAFVNAEKTTGWFRFTGLDSYLIFDLLPPSYSRPADSTSVDSHSGQDLYLLGYEPGESMAEQNHVMYQQKGWGGFSYQVSLRFSEKKGTTEGCWSISSEYPGSEKQLPAADQMLVS